MRRFLAFSICMVLFFAGGCGSDKGRKGKVNVRGTNVGHVSVFGAKGNNASQNAAENQTQNGASSQPAQPAHQDSGEVSASQPFDEIISCDNPFTSFPMADDEREIGGLEDLIDGSDAEYVLTTVENFYEVQRGDEPPTQIHFKTGEYINAETSDAGTLAKNSTDIICHNSVKQTRHGKNASGASVTEVYKSGAGSTLWTINSFSAKDGSYNYKRQYKILAVAGETSKDVSFTRVEKSGDVRLDLQLQEVNLDAVVASSVFTQDSKGTVRKKIKTRYRDEKDKNTFHSSWTVLTFAKQEIKK